MQKFLLRFLVFLKFIGSVLSKEKVAQLNETKPC